MTSSSRARRLIVSLAALVALGALTWLIWPTPVVGTAAQPRARFDQVGHLLRPDGYREWVYVGTPLTPNDLNPPAAAFPEFHNVYIDPESFAHWKKTGQFRDGTILIKELVTVGSKQASSGNGYFMGDFVGLEASVKDSTRFPREPGYWAYFTFSHEPPPYPPTAQIQPAAACNTACHQRAPDDWVFTQYYPVLRAAKGQ